MRQWPSLLDQQGKENLYQPRRKGFPVLQEKWIWLFNSAFKLNISWPPRSAAFRLCEFKFPIELMYLMNRPPTLSWEWQSFQGSTKILSQSSRPHTTQRIVSVSMLKYTFINGRRRCRSSQAGRMGLVELQATVMRSWVTESSQDSDTAARREQVPYRAHHWYYPPAVVQGENVFVLQESLLTQV